jgi:hypothetical protein
MNKITTLYPIDPQNPYGAVYGSKEKKLKTKKLRRILACVLILLFLSSSILGVFVSGFIPITSLLEIKEPIGCIEKLNKRKIYNNIPEIAAIKSIDKIKYEVFLSNCTISEINNNYASRLENEGYSLYQEGTSDKGFGMLYYKAYIKGFTAVVIMYLDQTIFLNQINYPQIINNKIDYNEIRNFVLYSTGSIFDFQDLLKELNI